MLNNKCLYNSICDKLTFSGAKLVDSFSRYIERCTTETYVIGNEFQVHTYPFFERSNRDVTILNYNLENN